jgi:uncharacterized protein (DUF111 family)
MTQWGVVHVKESSLGGVMANFSPEYEDCRRIAEENGLPLKLVQQEVSSAYIALKQQTASTISQTSPTRNSKSQIA